MTQYRFIASLDETCLEIEQVGNSIIVKNSILLEIKDKVLTASRITGIDVHDIRDGKKKVIYLYYKHVDKVCRESSGVEEFSTPLIHVKHTKTPLGNYTTIIPSGIFPVDYLVLSSGQVAIVIPGRREVYIERDKLDTVVIYIS